MNAIKTILCTTVVSICLIGSALAATPPNGAKSCATEGQTCNVPNPGFSGCKGTGKVKSFTVYYGAGNNWTTKNFSWDLTRSSGPSVSCSVQGFGTDPAPNVKKTCVWTC